MGTFAVGETRRCVVSYLTILLPKQVGTQANYGYGTRVRKSLASWLKRAGPLVADPPQRSLRPRIRTFSMRDCPNSHTLTVSPGKRVTAKHSADSGEPGHLAPNTHLSHRLAGVS